MCSAPMRKPSPSRSVSEPNLASQMRVAFSSMVWKAGSSSPGELEMTRSTSEAAVCWARASANSRVRALTCSCRSATYERTSRTAFGEFVKASDVAPAETSAQAWRDGQARSATRRRGETTSAMRSAAGPGNAVTRSRRARDRSRREPWSFPPASSAKRGRRCARS